MIETLPEICISYGKDCFVIALNHLFTTTSVKKSVLKEYFFEHLIDKFSEVTITEAFPQYPDILSIGFCSQNVEIISQTFVFITQLLPLYRSQIFNHYTSVMNLLQFPDILMNIPMDVITPYINTFAECSSKYHFDPLFKVRTEITEMIEKQKAKQNKNKLQQFIDENDLLLIQQSDDYQKMLGYVTTYCQTSLNHPLLSFLILPYCYQSVDFLEELQYSIGFFGTKHPFSHDVYLKQTDSATYLRLVTSLFKKYSKMKRWNDVLAASLSYTLISFCESDPSNMEFYELTEEDLATMNSLITSLLH